MIWLYGAVDDAEAAIGTFDETARADLAVLQAGLATGASRCGGSVPCIGRWSGDQLVQLSEQALREHSAAVQRIMAVCTVVPFRFRTVVPGVEDFHRELDGRAEELAELLTWLRGRVELAVRARCTDASPKPASSGREYLKSHRDRFIPRSLGELHHLLDNVAVAATACADGRHGMRSSYLVERESVDAFCNRARAAAARLPRVTDLSITGPWAPYSFVTVDWTRQAERALDSVFKPVGGGRG